MLSDGMDPTRDEGMEFHPRIPQEPGIFQLIDRLEHLVDNLLASG